jgi:hypothetical protein
MGKKKEKENKIAGILKQEYRKEDEDIKQNRLFLQYKIGTGN